LPGTGPNYWAWLFICLLFAFCAAGVAWYMRRNNRRRFATPGAGMVELPTQEDLPDVGDPDRSPSAPEEPITQASLDAQDADEKQDAPSGSTNEVEPKPSPETPEVAPESDAPHSSKAKKLKNKKHRHHK
jgi:hypothetical protein